MLDELTLSSGIDIPFNSAGLTIHCPDMTEIGILGEEDFRTGLQFLMFNKENLLGEDKIGLEQQSNFQIFMSVMNSSEIAKHKTDALMVLTLLFPEYEIKIDKDKILLQIENFSSSINEENFNEFQEILSQLFCLSSSTEDDTNPADALAAKIAEKIKKGKQRRADAKGENLDRKINVFSQYLSILEVGLKIPKTELVKYSVYQLNESFNRFKLKQDFDLYIKAKLAGAENLEEVDNWMENIHP